MTDNEIIKAWDILAKLDFFYGQRAGMELWFEKPIDIQDEDIRNFSNDVAFLKDFINIQNAEVERWREESGKQGVLWARHFEGIFETAKETIKAEAIKDFAERLKELINPDWCKIHQQIDNLVKEMIGEQE
jgi:hypothetical protein